MSNYKVTDTELISVANAIRTKGGTSAQLEWPSEFVSAIGNISGGGSGDILSGTDVPAASLGNDGDIYIQTFEIPSNVNFVEYLESSGTQYIDTGILVSLDLGMYLKGIYRGVTGWILGTRNANTIDSATVSLVSSSGSVNYKYCHKSFGSYHSYNEYSISNNYVYEERISVIDLSVGKAFLQTGKTSVNIGGRIDKASNATTTTYPIVLFGVNTSGTITMGNKVTLCRVVFTEHCVPIADYLPCLDGNGVACMWENVAGEYVYNDGSGDFAYGNTITPEPFNDIYYVKKNGSWIVIYDGSVQI